MRRHSVCGEDKRTLHHPGSVPFNEISLLMETTTWNGEVGDWEWTPGRTGSLTREMSDNFEREVNYVQLSSLSSPQQAEDYNKKAPPVLWRPSRIKIRGDKCASDEMKFKGIAKCTLDAFFVPFDSQIKWNYEESLHVITCNCFSKETFALQASINRLEHVFQIAPTALNL